MASGFFPVEPNDEWGKQLREAARLIGSVVDSWQYNTSCLTGEDQAHDQTYINELYSAVSNCEGCVKPDESDPQVVSAKIHDAAEKIKWGERELARWKAIEERLHRAETPTAEVTK